MRLAMPKTDLHIHGAARDGECAERREQAESEQGRPPRLQ